MKKVVIIINGERFHSRAEAREALQKNPTRVLQFEYTYDRIADAVNSLADGIPKAVSIDGVQYASLTEAAEALGVTPSAISYRVRRHGSTDLPRSRSYRGRE